MSLVVDDLAAKTPGKRSLAMEAFARALRALPTIICDNAGLDSADIVSRLRAAHAAAPDACRAGIDIEKGTVGDMQEVGGGVWGRGLGSSAVCTGAWRQFHLGPGPCPLTTGACGVPDMILSPAVGHLRVLQGQELGADERH